MKEINEDHKFNGQLKVETDQGREVNVNAGARPYKVYSALLNQSGTGAPEPVILENTIGDIVWTRITDGSYLGTLAGAFTEEKTLIFFSGVNTNSPNEIWDVSRLTSDTIGITCYQWVTDEPIATDNLITNRSIEIRVYP